MASVSFMAAILCIMLCALPVLGYGVDTDIRSPRELERGVRGTGCKGKCEKTLRRDVNGMRKDMRDTHATILDMQKQIKKLECELKKLTGGA